MSTPITYEFPLNERIRVFIRIEQLFLQLDHFMSGSTVIDKRSAIKALQDILLIFSRNDLKSEALKEIERQTKALASPSTAAKPDPEVQQAIADLHKISKKLYATSGKIGMTVMESDLLQSIAQRSAIPGGSCSFDLPAFHYWLEQDESMQGVDLDEWGRPFHDIRIAIDMLLALVRYHGKTTQEVAKEGFFQLGLDSSLSYQLLRISLERKQRYFAETSGGKHRFTVRMMTPSQGTIRPAQTEADVPFTLTTCVV